ncbi:MAG: hypothetical protein KAT68_19250 [Bacteroidales bacterium]|nr:hypothetical protein [Bacteroidales bacterium]
MANSTTREYDFRPLVLFGIIEKAIRWGILNNSSDYIIQQDRVLKYSSNFNKESIIKGFTLNYNKTSHDEYYRLRILTGISGLLSSPNIESGILLNHNEIYNFFNQFDPYGTLKTHLDNKNSEDLVKYYCIKFNIE